MICTRCGTVQRRETAKFCHVCGATIEPAPANAQPVSARLSATEATTQQAHGLRPISLTPPQSRGQSAPESLVTETAAAELSTQAAEEYDSTTSAADASADDSAQPALSNQPSQPAWQPSEQPGGNAADWQQTPPVSPSDQQPMWPNNRSQEEETPFTTPFAAPAAPSARPTAWPSMTPSWQQQPQEDVSERRLPTINRERPFPTAQQHRPNSAANPFGDPDEQPANWPSAARPLRSSAGPVPASLPRPQRARRRRLPLSILVSSGLLLIFILAGFGIYAVINSAGGQEPSAFVNYTDANRHFSIQYPSVWNYKRLPNGVKFADATDTAELSVTYVANTSNLTAQQFADQEAAPENLNGPDTKTFAGQTWVVRSGIVTQTSGISQDIFIFVTLYNNFLFEVREVAPLNGYKEPNQTAFMPMLQRLKLM